MMIDMETGEIKVDYVNSFGVFIRTPYNYDMNAASDASGLECRDETRAQQQFLEEVDINTIVERFGLTGELPNNLKVPLNEEFIEAMDYQDSLNKLMEADKAFMEMPAKIRAEFQNDAGKFVDFVSNPENVEKCREWGLVDLPEAPRSPLEVRVVPDPQV